MTKKVYLRAGKDKESKWYKSRLVNGGAIELDGQNYQVDYKTVDDLAEIKAVTVAYEKNYHVQYPIDMMVFDKCAEANVELIKK